MATSSSSAHRLNLDHLRESDETDRLVPPPAPPAEDDGHPGCQYFGDDAPTLRLLLPTAPAPAPTMGKETDSIPTTPMARLRLRRVAKRFDSDD